MKIALLGYGKMGKVIDQLATGAGDVIVLKVDEHNRATTTAGDLARADVAIDFSRPEAAVDNIRLAVAAGVPIVVGTTGWYGQLPSITAEISTAGGALFHATNFSVGVNVFFAAATQLSRLLGKYGGYTAEITETHHTQKLDAPSGTAITLAERYSEHSGAYEGWALASIDSPVPQQRIAPVVPHALPADSQSKSEANTRSVKKLPIHSVRKAGVPGTHILQVSSEVDTIEFKHTAHTREGFAKGALVAARWLVGKQGVFSMQDLLGE